LYTLDDWGWMDPHAVTELGTEEDDDFGGGAMVTLGMAVAWFCFYLIE
jgi:hypothetical protein